MMDIEVCESESNSVKFDSAKLSKSKSLELSESRSLELSNDKQFSQPDGFDHEFNSMYMNEPESIRGSLGNSDDSKFSNAEVGNYLFHYWTLYIHASTIHVIKTRKTSNPWKS